MLFNDHSKLAGEHAFLSASKYSWLRYTDEKLAEAYKTHQAAALGTRLHELAKEHILLSMRMPKNNATFNRYVNDAIGFKMTPEQVLYYSENCFGTADAIRFDERTKILRIHDLKTGTSRVSMDQLEIYAALFCLEYRYEPLELTYELRIYQNDEVFIHEPDGMQIERVMTKIVEADKIIKAVKEGIIP